uniref:Uncharacterized protein n=1 Tax=Solanum tuberosum TaxID=4113 RepID=M1DNJ9_SOLTU
MVIAKITKQTTERLFRSPKSQRASPREESIWRKEWAVSESPNDSAMATLITQMGINLIRHRPCELNMASDVTYTEKGFRTCLRKPTLSNGGASISRDTF